MWSKQYVHNDFLFSCRSIYRDECGYFGHGEHWQWDNWEIIGLSPTGILIIGIIAAYYLIKFYKKK